MPNRWLKLTIAYDGSAYAGWQIQPDKPTVQGVVQKAWRDITQEVVRLTAAGRTDAGVHASGQVAGLVTESHLANEVLHQGLNAVLPGDVVVLAVENARDGFHATRDAVSKRYCYQIHNHRVAPVFDRHFTWHYPRPLDMEAMHRAGQYLVGRHDFSSFESAGSPRPDSVRTIHRLKVSPWASQQALIAPTGWPPLRAPHGDAPPSDRITIEVLGDGFLYNMVRSIVGTLVEVGRGRRAAEWAREVLEARDRRQAGQTAPPQGLFLVEVNYD